MSFPVEALLNAVEVGSVLGTGTVFILWLRRRRYDWHRTGRTRLHAIKRAGNYALVQGQVEYVDMNTGETHWFNEPHPGAVRRVSDLSGITE